MNEPVSYAEFSRVMDKLVETQIERNAARRKAELAEARLARLLEWSVEANTMLDMSGNDQKLVDEFEQIFADIMCNRDTPNIKGQPRLAGTTKEDRP